MTARLRGHLHDLIADQRAPDTGVFQKAGEKLVHYLAYSNTKTSSERIERIHRMVMRFLLPLVLYGIGQLLYWIWFDYTYQHNFWWKSLETVPLLLAMLCVAIWWTEVSIPSDQ